ncbi:MAG: hypothetical protein ACRDRA_05430 [Pseudonocardiaceae bacterium]
MTVMIYQTRDGRAEYGFSIDYEPDRGWRAYIVFRPFHQDGSNNLKLPYQSTDSKGRHYVNWSEKLDNLGDAKAVAALWAEVAQRYQNTQEQTALYLEGIKQYQRAQARRRANSVTPAESSSDRHESESKTQATANATSEMAARADGNTATTPANGATHSTVPPKISVRHCRHCTPGMLRHQRSTRHARRRRRGANNQ